jgi:hypothetical protein
LEFVYFSPRVKQNYASSQPSAAETVSCREIGQLLTTPAALAYKSRIMPSTQILQPVFALVALTFCVLLQIPIARFRAAARGAVTAADFRLGESDKVPEQTRLPNRNYMNLLELPVLFYVACLAMYVTQRGDAAACAIAWIYVGLRALHSLIHVTYNHVWHRLLAFGISNVVLSVLWVRFFFVL